jgi:hypothetical protein
MNNYAPSSRLALRKNCPFHFVSLFMSLGTRVFLDPNRIETFDGRGAYGEDRWKTVGLVEPALLAVVYTIRGVDGHIVRLISARKADANERTQYSEI